MSVPTISAKELAELCRDKKVDLIDVRTPSEFGEVRAVHARNVPLDRLDPKDVVANRNCHPEQPIYVICRSGARGEQACHMLIKDGLTNVINVEGGTLAWEQAGLPVARGRKAMPLDRQMRTFVGSLILLGWFTALLVGNLYIGIGIALFFGCGLLFSGVTGICPMMNMIARMPWNQRSEVQPCCDTNTAKGNATA